MTHARKLDQFSREVVKMLPILFREFAKRENNELTRGMITFPQMVTLDLVFHRHRVNMSEIAKSLSIQMSSTTVLVDRLIRGKMLSRERDKMDRRLVWIQITEKGKKVIRTILTQKQRSIEEIFGLLKAQERTQYLRILRKVCKVIGGKAA